MVEGREEIDLACRDRFADSGYERVAGIGAMGSLAILRGPSEARESIAWFIRQL